jgi:hypothetical protein
MEGKVKLVITVFAIAGLLLLVAVTVKEIVAPAGGKMFP